MPITVPDGEGERARKIIMEEILPGVSYLFEKKSADYSDTFMFLGAKGQFSDMNRKFWKLYYAIWQDKDLDGEQPEEIVQDMIGHCLLLLFCLREEKQDA